MCECECAAVVVVHGKCALCMCVEDVGHGFGIPNGLFMNMLC